MNQVILIDGKNFCFRMHYTHQKLSSKGQSTSVLFGGLNGLVSLAKRIPNTPIVFVWDGGGKTWRHKMSPKKERPPVSLKTGEPVPPKVREPGEEPKAAVPAGYKAQRVHTSDAAMVMQQLPIFEDFLKRLGFRQYKIKGVEGDDLIGIITHQIVKEKLMDEVIVHSTDRDFFQLITPKVHVLRSIDPKVGVRYITDREVREEFGIEIKDWCKLRAIIGDKSDNIPQIFAGVGPKTAAKFIQKGLDPSLRDFEDHDKDVIREFGPMFKTYWTDIHRNYILSKIVKATDFKKFEDNTRQVLKDVVGGAIKLTRKKSVLTDETFDWMTDFFAKYDMQEMLLARRALWSIP